MSAQKSRQLCCYCATAGQPLPLTPNKHTGFTQDAAGQREGTHLAPATLQGQRAHLPRCGLQIMSEPTSDMQLAGLSFGANHANLDQCVSADIHLQESP